MPSHVHTPPQCGFWTGHDPSCFDQAFGVERDCVLIELGKNKGNYLCIHERAPITSLTAGRATISPQVSRDQPSHHVPGRHIAGEELDYSDNRMCRYLTPELAAEYSSINAELRPPADPQPAI